MEAVVCIKPVPEADSRLRVAASGVTYDPEGVRYTLNSTYDEAALEEALRLKEAGAFEKVRVVSLGPPRAEEGLRYALAMGGDEGLLVETRPDDLLDPGFTAAVLAEAVRSLPHDLVLVGRRAGDDEAGVVGSALGEHLGIPSFAFVTGLTVSGGGSPLKVRRFTEAGEELLSVPPPVVISLLKGAQDPRTPTLPNILKARRKPLLRASWTEVLSRLPGAPVRSPAMRFELPPPRTGARLVDYQTPAEAAEKLVKLLREEAKVL